MSASNGELSQEKSTKQTSLTAGLFQHQTNAVQFFQSHRNIFLHHDTGTGKTRTALEIFAASDAERMIVFAPLSLLSAAWGEDIKKFSGFSFRNLHEEFEFDADIMAINYEGLLSAKKYEAIRKFARAHKILCVLDESSRLKNHKSVTAKKLLAMQNDFYLRVAMSGTPCPNSLVEYFAQMEFVSPGLLGGNFYKFRNTFFHLERNGNVLIQNGAFMTRHQARELFSKGWKYDITAAKRDQLMKLIESRCHRAIKSECLDLPEQIDLTRHVFLNAIQAKAYKEMKRDMLIEINNQPITAQNALTILMKLRQVTSGFAYDEYGQPQDLCVENPKIEEMLLAVDELDPKEQVIIWANFHREIRWIRDALKDRGRVVTLYSETEDRNESINDFIRGDARFLVAHPRSAAHGLTFVNCSTEIFFSLDYSFEAYEQAKARIHRYGQKFPCVYIHLLAKGTIDEAILKALNRKSTAKELVDEIIYDGKRTTKPRYAVA